MLPRHHGRDTATSIARSKSIRNTATVIYRTLQCNANVPTATPFHKQSEPLHSPPCSHLIQSRTKYNQSIRSFPCRYLEVPIPSEHAVSPTIRQLQQRSNWCSLVQILLVLSITIPAANQGKANLRDSNRLLRLLPTYPNSHQYHRIDEYVSAIRTCHYRTGTAEIPTE